MVKLSIYNNNIIILFLQYFPLKQNNLKVAVINKKSDAIESDIRVKSDLMLALEATEGFDDTDKIEDKILEEQQLTREEILARSKEMRMLRIRESQQKAKARMRNKIKSKKFHRIMKREKMKQQIKEFEALQKLDPEAALQKLEQLDKHRIVERANLRHKNTGTWAKSLQIRAKYDKDVRKELSQQLAISRELTQKNRINDSNDDEDDEDDDVIEDNNKNILPNKKNTNSNNLNPWFKTQHTENSENEMNQFVTNYKQYWLERNKNQMELEEYRKDDKIEMHLQPATKDNELQKNEKTEKQLNEIGLSNKKKKIKNITYENGWLVEECNTNELLLNNNDTISAAAAPVAKDKKLKVKLPKNKKNKYIENIDDIFDNAEDIIKEKFTKKLNKIKTDMEKSAKRLGNKRKKTINKLNKNTSDDLSFKKIATRPTIDEELTENVMKNSTIDNADDVNDIKKSMNSISEFNNNSFNKFGDKTNKNQIDNINPDNFLKTKIKHLNTALPDEFHSEDIYENDDVNGVADNMTQNIDMEKEKRLTIAEAFQDDDIVADFERDKDDERKKSQPEDIDLTLPGWGSWAGCGLKPRTKKLILTFPKVEKRRDDNRGSLVINENLNTKLRQHLVSDLPFPFTSVTDFECSIRAPIGTSFITPSASKLLTRPAVNTKLGTIIEPMDDDILLNKSLSGYKTTTDLRIEQLKDKKDAKKL